VAILGAVVDLDWDARQGLDQELADQPGVPRRPTGDDGHLLGSSEDVLGEVELLQEDSPLLERRSAENGVSRGGRLLKDFLEHEVLVPTLFRRDRIPE